MILNVGEADISVLRSARISLSLSIFRILPPGRLKSVALGCAIACFVVGSALLVYELAMLSLYKVGWETGFISNRSVTMLVVGPRTVGKQSFRPPLPPDWRANPLTADILSSLVLVGLPLYALSKMTALPSSERRMLLILFAGTLLVLASGCAMAAFMFLGSAWGATYSAHLQVC